MPSNKSGKFDSIIKKMGEIQRMFFILVISSITEGGREVSSSS